MNRKKTKEQVSQSIKEILSLKEQGFNIDKLEACKYRINNRVDIYVLRSSYHKLDYNRWGKYKDLEDIKKLVKI